MCVCLSVCLSVCLCHLCYCVVLHNISLLGMSCVRVNVDLFIRYANDKNPTSLACTACTASAAVMCILIRYHTTNCREATLQKLASSLRLAINLTRTLYKVL